MMLSCFRGYKSTADNLRFIIEKELETQASLVTKCYNCAFGIEFQVHGLSLLTLPIFLSLLCNSLD